MAVKVEKDLSNMKRLNTLVKRDYSRRLLRPLKQAILKDILRGVSPVRGEGKFKKYSKSYKLSIRGKVQFFTVNSGGTTKTIAIKAGRGETLPTLPHVLGKRLSPVNLKLSGEMLSSLKLRALGSATSRKIEIVFEDDVAVFHNKLGAGKAKVKRRLLPTESGERFNRRISKLTTTILSRSVSSILEKFNRP